MNRPTGNEQVNLFTSYAALNDNEFYHFSLHGKKLRRKIEKGSYVDLAKLIRKNRSVANKNENGVELISKEGRSYLMPAANTDNPVINLFGKLDQAFRVYTGIYTKANPHRGHDLIQHFPMQHTGGSPDLLGQCL